MSATTALPGLGSTLLRGANITVRGSYAPRAWHNLWRLWEWTDWIKFQVDLAVSVGANAIRLFGDVTAVTEGLITEAQYHARWMQFLDYLGALGMRAYPCMSDMAHWNTTTLQQAASLYETTAALFETHPTVFAIDLANEASGGTEDERVATLTTLRNAVRTSTTKPLTISGTVGADVDWAHRWFGTISHLCDFLDFHVYAPSGPTTAEVQPLLSKWWAQKPIILGEFGSHMSESTEVRTGRYQAVKALLASYPQFGGGFVWDLASDDMGLFSAAGVERTDIMTVFRTFAIAR